MQRIKNIQPLGNIVITTAEKYTRDELSQRGIIVNSLSVKGAYKMIQRVESVGPLVRGISTGDYVKVNMLSPRYATLSRDIQREQMETAKNDPNLIVKDRGIEIHWPVVRYGGPNGDDEHLKLFSDDIEYVVELEEDGDSDGEAQS